MSLRSLRWNPHVVLASLSASLLGLTLPLLMIQVYDRIIPNSGLSTLSALAVGLAAASLLDFIVRRAQGHIVSRAGLSFEFEAHEAAFAQLLHVGADPFDRRSPGDTYDKLASIDRIRQHYCSPATSALLDIPFLLIFLALLTLISPVFGASVIALATASVGAVWALRRRILQLKAERQDRDRRRHSFLVETLTGIEMIKSFGIEEPLTRRYERLMAGSSLITAKLTGRINFLHAVMGTIGITAPVIMSGLGTLLVMQEKMSIGGLAASVLLTGRIIQPVLRIEALLAGEQDIRHSEADFRELLSKNPRAAGDLPVGSVETLKLNNLNWAASPDTPLILRDVSITLHRGDCVLLNGASRSGRSSLLGLIAGHLLPSGGDIWINGLPMEKCDPVEVNRRIRVLSCEYNMLEGTLMENLTGFDEEHYRDKAFELARELGIDKHISRHAEGLRMRVSSNLTGSLARSLHDAVFLISSLATEPDVILFDEANVGLDHLLDKNFLEMLRRRVPNAIIVMVSNRPAYQKLANRHLLLAHGTVTEVANPNLQTEQQVGKAS